MAGLDEYAVSEFCQVENLTYEVTINFGWMNKYSSNYEVIIL
jgi:hypothetical protein